MLFSSYEFILAFLPIVLAGYYLFSLRRDCRLVMIWLLGCSLFFYAWWDFRLLPLLCGSILFNFVVGILLVRWRNEPNVKCLTLTIGIVFNIGLLAYFKYADFLAQSIGAVIGQEFRVEGIILPLAISFFTFQQIAYLVDVHRVGTSESSLTRYAMFVAFFPQLVAGPIVHHSDVLPQFSNKFSRRFRARNLIIGSTIFTLGLFKKAILADGVSHYSDMLFTAVSQGRTVTFLDTWGGMLAFTFEIYFDFSGYSDMAIGLAIMFGIRLPANFHSPYKATNIIEFWRRWHMTLSRFLRDYLYIPIGGGRVSELRRHSNLIVTMLVGGLWHGASWNFVIWGGIHGVMLAVNQLWRDGIQSRFGPVKNQSATSKALWTVVTFLAVTLAWVPFRAATLNETWVIYQAMLGQSGISLPSTYFTYLGPLGPVFKAWGMTTTEASLFQGISQIISLLAISVIVWFMPNTQQLMVRYYPVLETYSHLAYRKWSGLSWRPTFGWAILLACLAVISILALERQKPFIYFQF